MVQVTLYVNKFITHLTNYWISYILIILSLLMTIAFYTLAERKFMGALQRRKGPDVVGFLGLLQAIADGVKLVLKEIILPYKISMVLFLIGPSLVFFLSLCGWIVLPFSDVSFAGIINLSVLFVFVSSGLNIYGLVLSGWSSNSRYAFLGGIRATAQMISYELVLSMINLFIFFLAGSFNFTEIVKAQTMVWFIFPLFPVFIIFVIVMLAETNRTPFDLAEAEAELVAGYNVEYSSITFALFFLGEYANMIFLSFLGTIFFLGGWNIPFISGTMVGISEFIFVLKVLIFCMVFIWIRATLPRYRYDQLMELAWKTLLPILFSYFLFVITIMMFWKNWLFDFMVLGTFLMNFIYICAKVISTFHLFTEYINYSVVFKSQNSFSIAKIATFNDVTFSLVHPIKELLALFDNYYTKNSNYSDFFIHKKTKISFFSRSMRLYMEDIYSTYNGSQYTFKRVLSKVSKIYVRYWEIDDRYQQTLKNYKLYSKKYFQFNCSESYYNYIDPKAVQRMTRDGLLILDCDFLNKAAKKHFKTNNLRSIPIPDLMSFWEELAISRKKHFIFTQHVLLGELIKDLDKYKQILVGRFIDQFKPLYAPFLFLSKLWDMSEKQVFQIFPFKFSTFHVSIVGNQYLINAKYV